MTVQQVIRSVGQWFVAWYDQVSGKAEARRKRIIKYGIIGVCACVMLAAVWGGYEWYVSHREQSAQKTLSFCLDEYFKVQRGQYISWQDFADRCQRGADSHSSSYLYPYFKMLQADALVHVGDEVAALAAMDTSFYAMRASDPLYHLCALKYRLMQLDSTQEDIRNKGLEGLQVLAHDQKNICADAAQFYLGQYYMSQNQPENAQQEWKSLMAQKRTQPGMSSPWAELVSGLVAQ